MHWDPPTPPHKLLTANISAISRPIELKFLCMHGGFYILHTKFQPIWRNRKKVMAVSNFYCLKILQRCMEYCSTAGSLFWLYRFDPFHLESNHAKFQLNPLRNGWDIDCLEFRWGGGVGSDALLSSSPSLIWLQLGFGLARAVTISAQSDH